MPCSASRKATEKMPAESAPCRMGVSNTCHVFAASAEWKTRAALPPVANQMLRSGAEAPSFGMGRDGAEVAGSSTSAWDRMPGAGSGCGDGLRSDRLRPDGASLVRAPLRRTDPEAGELVSATCE